VPWRSAARFSGYIPSMPSFEPVDPAFEPRVRASFARQQLLTATLGATLERVAPGEVDVRLPFRAALSQQHGFLHGGAITSIVDAACGYAALTLMPAGAAVLSVEFKVNFLAPGGGETFLARGRVLKAGRTVTVCTGEVLASGRGQEKLVATMTATMMTVRDRPDLVD
jgi:uncharacterized protein (TIGR00369 family)